MFEKIKSLLQTRPEPILAQPAEIDIELEVTPIPISGEYADASPYDAKIVDTAADSSGEAISSLLDIETNGLRGDAVALRLSFLRREPVMDKSERLIGYELSLRNRPSPLDAKPDDTVLLMNDKMLLKSVFELGVDRLLKGKLAILPISSLVILHSCVDELTAKNIVFAIPLPETKDEALLKRCRELKTRGFRFVIDVSVCRPEIDTWLKIADYVRFNITEMNAIDLGKEIVAVLKSGVRPLIAMGVDSEEHFEASRKLAFNYFSGYYFTKPQASVPTRLDNHRIKVIELLNLVRSRVEIKELEASVKRDAAITFKILRYINSPANGLLQEIRSIAHALTLLGYDQMYRWLTLLLFVSDKPDPRSMILLKNALVRARLVELLGKDKIAGPDQDGLFLVGILSLLDSLLNLPMEKALENFHLPQQVSLALLEHQGIYAPYLGLAIACEAFDQKAIELWARTCGLDALKVNVAHVDAMVWAEEIDR
ncbi:MAG: HDOD domain-containing protein [Sulfuricellaceae bacterium]|nr:HDOD domain-containing protein [Sulfuricellaceae bacterium]